MIDSRLSGMGSDAGRDAKCDKFGTVPSLDKVPWTRWKMPRSVWCIHVLTMIEMSHLKIRMTYDC